MNKRPLIFITNDDGVTAKGLSSIVDAMRKIGRVVVVAPEVHQSGMSQAITMYAPLRIKKIRKEQGLEIYTCSGTPVDCVKMAFDHLLEDEFPDITVSGINHGANSAISVLYSGTVGAAIEASFYGRPAVALSLLDHDSNADFTTAIEYSVQIIKQVLASDLQTPLCLNVNIPAVTKEQMKGVMVCRQNKGYWKEIFVKRQDPRGNDYYWLTGDFDNAEPQSKDTDVWALRNNYVSVVPIQTDMTHYEHLKQLKDIL